MRQSIAAVALIRREEQGRRLWLAQWNRHWQRYHFIGGHKRPEESFRQCAIREIGEELGLQEGTDFLVATEPRTRLEYEAWSERAQEQTAYEIELFDVELTGEAALSKINDNASNRWLTEEEIRTERTKDGRPVSETMKRIMNAIEPVR